MLNNQGLIYSLCSPEGRPHPARVPLASLPCIARNLPTTASLGREAEAAAVECIRASVLRDAMAEPLILPEDAKVTSPPETENESRRKSSFFDLDRVATWGKKAGGKGQGLDLNGSFEPWHVLRAVEKKDIMMLAEIKSRQFDLLATGNPLPIVYCMRLGKSHEEVAIILIGAMSRKVNDTTDDELAMMQSSTKATLRALRANLKIALSAALHPSSLSTTTLCSSFLQVLLMLEGSRFLQSASQDLSLALRSPVGVGKPIETAQRALLRWVSRELKERQVASVEEYLANAAGDLVMLGLWGVVMDQVPTGKTTPVPLYYFARDDRIHRAVEERVSLLRSQHLYGKLSLTTKRQLEATLDVLGRRTMNGPQRVEMLKGILDRGEKVKGSSVRY